MRSRLLDQIEIHLGIRAPDSVVFDGTWGIHGRINVDPGKSTSSYCTQDISETYNVHLYVYIYFTYMAAPRLIPHIKLNKMKKDEHGLSFLLLAHLFQGQQLLKNARRPLRCYHGSCKGTSHPNHPLHPSISDWNSPWNTLW